MSKTRVKFQSRVFVDKESREIKDIFIEGYIDGYVGDAYACVVAGDKIHHVSIAKLTVISENPCTPEKKSKRKSKPTPITEASSNKSPSE